MIDQLPEPLRKYIAKHTSTFNPYINSTVLELYFHNGYRARFLMNRIYDPEVVGKLALMAGATGINAQVVDL